MLVLGIDPGPVLCGWAIVNTVTWTVLDSGHDNLAAIKARMSSPTSITSDPDQLVVENVTLYTLKSAKVDSKVMVPTIQMIGRFMEIADQKGIPITLIDRPSVILSLTGSRPHRNFKVSKADMQDIVQKLLDRPAPVRPQHANDAVAAVLAVLHPSRIQPDGTGTGSKKKKPRGRPSQII